MFRYITDAEAEQLKKEKEAQRGEKAAANQAASDDATSRAGQPVPRSRSSSQLSVRAPLRANARS